MIYLDYIKVPTDALCTISLRDQSLITERGRGATKCEIGGPKRFVPPSRQGKTFCIPLLKSETFLRPHFSMAKFQAPLLKPPQNVVCLQASEWLKFLCPLFLY